MRDSYLPRWRKVATTAGSVVAPDERLSWPQTAAMGVQHVIAMFGATVLAPILMGFNPNIATVCGQGSRSSGATTVAALACTWRQRGR